VAKMSILGLSLNGVIDAYSREMSSVLANWMSERGITHQAVANVLGRSRDYVSKRLRAESALTVDIIGAVAHLSSISPRALHVELTERMGKPKPEPGKAPTVDSEPQTED